MILPIVAYGDPVLRREAEEIGQDYENLSVLIDNMFETMEQANGVGLAAPQIDLSIRLFIVDTTPFVDSKGLSEEEKNEMNGFREVFINPIVIEEEGKPWAFEEGCFSIPGINEDVRRKPTVTIEYYNREWQLIEKTFSGLIARVIQHEYDHIEGVLFTDKINALKRRLISRKLESISKGIVDANYQMKFYKPRKAK
jgi:peptide deformylase